MYSALGKCFRLRPWQELPLVALHGQAQYTFQAPHTASILAAFLPKPKSHFEPVEKSPGLKASVAMQRKRTSKRQVNLNTSLVILSAAKDLYGIEHKTRAKREQTFSSISPALYPILVSTSSRNAVAGDLQSPTTSKSEIP